MIRVELSKIIIDEKRQDQIIVLKEKGGERQFPIVIGFIEATSIKLELSKVRAPRPLTHDLLISVIETLGAKVESLAIDKMVKSTFHAKLTLVTEKDEKKIVDCRPSDGVAIAVRSHAPIFVAEDILGQAQLFKPET